MIRLNVFIEVAEGKREEALALAKALVAPTLKEEGCIAYDIFESATRRNVLMFCETWQDEQTLSAHSQTPHFKELVPQLQALTTVKLETFQF